MKQQLQQVLTQRQIKRIISPGRIVSAVLIPIYCKDGQYHILFTQRTDRVKTHKGQISFPGGAHEETDKSLVDTALREAQEEIGLKMADVEVLGELDDINSATTDYTISPFVAVIPSPYQFILNEEEAAELIDVPISALLDRRCVRQETETYDGETLTTYFYQYHDKVIWGATARILNQFLNIFAEVARTEKQPGLCCQ